MTRHMGYPIGDMSVTPLHAFLSHSKIMHVCCHHVIATCMSSHHILISTCCLVLGAAICHLRHTCNMQSSHTGLHHVHSRAVTLRLSMQSSYTDTHPYCLARKYVSCTVSAHHPNWICPMTYVTCAVTLFVRSSILTMVLILTCAVRDAPSGHVTPAHIHMHTQTLAHVNA